jgi:hypothetical protein
MSWKELRFFATHQTGDYQQLLQVFENRIDIGTSSQNKGLLAPRQIHASSFAENKSLLSLLGNRTVP